ATARPLTPLLRHDEQADLLSDAEFSPNSERVISFGSTTRVWDATTGRLLFTFAGTARGLFTFGGTARGLTRNARRVFTSDGKVARWWDTSTGELLTTLEGEIATRVGDVSRDGRRLLAEPTWPPKPKQVQVWDTNKGDR